MRAVPFFAPAVAALVALVTVGPACSSSSAKSPDGAAPGDTASASTPTCSQLKLSDVQGLMTNTVVGDDVTVVGPDGDGQQCIFHDANSEQDIDIIVVPSADDTVGYAAAMKTTASPEALTGIGDQGFHPMGDDEMFAEHGGVMCTISVGEDTQIPGTDKLIVNGTLNLTDAQDAIVAEALGTICNRIFGTGNTTPDLSGL